MPWIIIGVVVLLIVVVIGIYNSLVKKRNRVDQSESDIDVQLKRRYDLIPNLIETVKGYAKHERETLDAVVEARANAMKQTGSTSQSAQKAENILEGALKNLFALSESYPDLKASTNFVELQRDLTDTEDKIQAARRFYNDTLRIYFDALQTFPSNMVAGLFSFKAQGDYFDISPAEAANPQVKF
ncbi:MAG: LemA family protein [Candidatus Saccharibacteria bacterium]|nr:LemA family protein [Candidatus Saccharibacteria bacterium]